MLSVRPMTAEDVPDCAVLLNHIIALGGSTAYEDPFTSEGFAGEFLQGPVLSHVVTQDRRILGFQVCFEDPPGVYGVGTFTDRRAPVKGAGRALFEATLAACRARGGEAIVAAITSDNTGGLAYYDRMGFVDVERIENHKTRRSGETVDRVIKRFSL